MKPSTALMVVFTVLAGFLLSLAVSTHLDQHIKVKKIAHEFTGGSLYVVE